MTIKKEDLELIVSGGTVGAAGTVAEPCPAVPVPAQGWGCTAGWPRCPPTLLWHSPQMTEMEISRAAAERSLREHMGNVVEALITLTN